MSQNQMNRIAELLNTAYIAIAESNDAEEALGCIAEAKAIAENDYGSMDNYQEASK